MVSSVTKLVVIGAGLALAVGIGYIVHQNLSADTLSGQLARSRLGLDKPPPLGSIVSERSEYGRPTSQQPKDRLHELVDEIIQNATRNRYTGGGNYSDSLYPPSNFTLPSPSSSPSPSSYSSKAAGYYAYPHRHLSAEEEQYEP
ncbi:MAG TPA: hypothetical protein VKA91_09385 [Nitrososphaeraceae archaeon]|nr:hypothetical protein [Nitrososphaeraceae archaeon]